MGRCGGWASGVGAAAAATNVPKTAAVEQMVSNVGDRDDKVSDEHGECVDVGDD